MKRAERKPLTADRLRELLVIDPETGKFTRRVRACNGQDVGDEVGSPTSSGAVCITIDRVSYLAHRLVVLYQTGEWPQGHVDHRQGIRSDNRPSELRDVTRSGNMQNQRRPHANNKTGYLGVSKFRDKFLAGIRVDGKRKHLGLFDTPELASAAYLSAKRELHGTCTI